jgi:hypothetical protein
VNHPPSTGPIAAVMEVNPDHVPIARPRSLRGKEALIGDKTSRHEERAADTL